MVSITVNDFMVVAPNIKQVYRFHKILTDKYKVKLL